MQELKVKIRFFEYERSKTSFSSLGNRLKQTGNTGLVNNRRVIFRLSVSRLKKQISQWYFQIIIRNGSAMCLWWGSRWSSAVKKKEIWFLVMISCWFVWRIRARNFSGLKCVVRVRWCFGVKEREEEAGRRKKVHCRCIRRFCERLCRKKWFDFYFHDSRFE